MGNMQSVFYPDNPSRHSRAQQLADDCAVFRSDYSQIKKEVEETLGQYKDEMYEVLNAFGCRNVKDLDELVKKTATDAGLEEWKTIKSSVDGLSDASDVISAVSGIVAIAGITISVIGSLAGGFGFVAGMTVTSTIVMVLGIIGAIFDAISGAIQRAQLRDAINTLIPLRMKIKYLAAHIRLIQDNIGGIKMFYVICKNLGYDKDKIIQELKTLKVMKSKKLTYHDVGKDLLAMDQTRLGGSWRNEDPSWENIAKYLDDEVESNRMAESVSTFAASPHFPKPPEIKAYEESEKRLMYMNEHHMHYIPSPEMDKTTTPIDISFTTELMLSPLLQGGITIDLKHIIDEVSAAVQLKTTENAFIKTNPVQNEVIATSDSHFADWTISFARAEQAHQFAMVQHTLSEQDLRARSVDVRLRADTPDAQLYLRADGNLMAIGDVLTASYS